MPIEIRELVIKAAVANSPVEASSKSSTEDKAQEIIQLTLDQMNEIKRNENER
jgi:Family of unknown function (DUF5908)